MLTTLEDPKKRSYGRADLYDGSVGVLTHGAEYDECGEANPMIMNGLGDSAAEAEARIARPCRVVYVLNLLTIPLHA